MVERASGPAMAVLLRTERGESLRDLRELEGKQNGRREARAAGRRLAGRLSGDRSWGRGKAALGGWLRVENEEGGGWRWLDRADPEEGEDQVVWRRLRWDRETLGFVPKWHGGLLK